MVYDTQNSVISNPSTMIAVITVKPSGLSFSPHNGELDKIISQAPFALIYYSYKKILESLSHKSLNKYFLN